ncbi:unnamed protein product, partial [Schistosoma turkestanicum]
VIAGLASLIESGVSGPFLIISPLSLISVWADQLATFAPRLPCIVYYGAMKERLELQKQIRRRVHVPSDGPDTISVPNPICPQSSETSLSSSSNTDVTLSNSESVLENSIGSLSNSSSSLHSDPSLQKHTLNYVVNDLKTSESENIFLDNMDDDTSKAPQFLDDNNGEILTKKDKLCFTTKINPQDEHINLRSPVDEKIYKNELLTTIHNPPVDYVLS